MERKSEDVLVLFSYSPASGEDLNAGEATRLDCHRKNSSSTGFKFLLTCNEVWARIVKTANVEGGGENGFMKYFM